MWRRRNRQVFMTIAVTLLIFLALFGVIAQEAYSSSCLLYTSDAADE